MAEKFVINVNTMPVVGSSYYCYIMARFFASLFGIGKNQFCQIRK